MKTKPFETAINLFNKFTRNDYVFSMLTKITSSILAIISSIFINRYLGPALKGEYAVILNTINLVTIIANFGFYQSYPNQKRKKMNCQLEKYLDAFALQLLVYLTFALTLGLLLHNSIYLFVLILIPIQVMTTQLGMVALVDFLRFSQGLSIILALLKILLCGFVFLFAPQSLLYIFGILILHDFLIIVIYLVKVRYMPNPFHVDLRFIKFLFTFGFFAMLSALLNNLNYKVDVLLLKYLSIDNVQIGLYSTGVALAEYAWLIPDAFKNVLFSKTAKNDSVNDIVFSLKINLNLSIIMLLGILLFGRFVIILLYGYEFADSYQVTALIFLGIPSMVIFKIVSPLYIAQGKQTFYFLALASSVVVNVVLNLLVIPPYGIIGAALSSVFSYSVCGLFFYIKFITDYKIKWYQPLFINISDLKAFAHKLKSPK